jgi:predicted nuclease with TOPRIM domain
MRLRGWHDDYAPSQAWAKEAAGKELEWSRVVSAAAVKMGSSERSYSDQESFFQALLAQIRNPSINSELGRADKERVKAYRTAVAKKSRLLKYLRNEATSRDKIFYENAGALTSINEEISEAATALQELSPDSEAFKKEAEHLKGLIQKRTQMRADIKELGAERSTIETSFQKPLAELDARISAAEKGIAEAFEAALPAARPVSSFFLRHTLTDQLAIRVGNEGDPLHIVYVLTWYGIEGLIAFLVCLVIVPWLLRLGGDSADPKASRSKVTERIKGLITTAFGAKAAAALSKAAAVAAVAGLTMAGISSAAGNPPPIAPVVLHEEPSTGPQGNRGENGKNGEPGLGVKGETGEAGKQGPQGIPGAIPEEWKALLDQQAQQIAEQSLVIERLEVNLTEISNETRRTRSQMWLLARNASLLNANATRLTTQVSNLSQCVADLDASLEGVTFANDLAKKTLLGYLDTISHTTFTMASDLEQVTAQVRQARDVPPTSVDLLRINGIPDGALTRVSPFSRYRVTGEVVDTVKRATRYSNEAPATTIVSALLRLKNENDAGGGNTKMGILKFRRRVSDYAGTDPKVKSLLNDLMPLILKLSRIQG